MKNKIKFLATLNVVPACVGCATLASCGNNDEPKTSLCTVTFISGEHGHISEVQPIVVQKGTLWKDIQKPEATADADYKFDNWYVDSMKCSDQFIINNDINPTAKFELIYANQVPTNFGGKKAFNYGRITDSVNETHVETFYIKQGEKFTSNPNFAEAMMLDQCIRYKKKHPNEHVFATLSTFHYSYRVAACIDKTKPQYGMMKSLYDCEENDEGYIRISYLLIKAAKAGVEVYSVGQHYAWGEPSFTEPNNFEDYFNGHMDDMCDDGIHKVKDFLNFKRCKWPGYGEKAGTDLMHIKNCTVSHYTDDNGLDHDSATYVTSSNLDMVYDSGLTGCDSYQTGIVVSDHKDLARCFYNYTKLLCQYCNKEDSVRFRNIIRNRNKTQIDRLSSGQSVSKDEQIVYLGTKKDTIFELYITPLGGSAYNYDTKYNPFCKYISKLLYQKNCNLMELSWVNPNFNDDSEFTRTIIKSIDTALVNNPSLNNKLTLGFMTLNEGADFNNLKTGENIKTKSVGDLNKKYGIHAKDLTLCYTNSSQNQYITLWNTLNFHMGSNYYQSNSILITKENVNTHNSLYVNLSKFITFGTISESELI